MEFVDEMDGLARKQAYAIKSGSKLPHSKFPRCFNLFREAVQEFLGRSARKTLLSKRGFLAESTVF